MELARVFLAPETESSRLARCKKAATEESDSDSAGDGVHQLPCGPDPDREDQGREARTGAQRCLLHLESCQGQGAGDQQGPRHLTRAVRGAEGPA